MPKENMQETLKQKPYLLAILFENPIGLSFLSTNLSLFLIHPTDRIKTAMHLNLSTTSWQITRSFFTTENYANLYRGLSPNLLQQNIRMIPWTVSTTIIPELIDRYSLPLGMRCFLKAISAAGIETFCLTPLEIIKTRQMSEKEAISLKKSIMKLYQEKGVSGFFTGSKVSMMKTTINWYYLYLTYALTEEKTAKQDFLNTLFLATLISIPNVLVTGPFDLIKSREQAGLIPKEISSYAAAKLIAKEFGLLSLWRGFFPRLVSKGLTTAIAYEVQNLSTKKNNCDDDNNQASCQM